MTKVRQSFPPQLKKQSHSCSAMFFSGKVSDCAAYIVTVECTLIGAWLCASAFEVGMRLTSKVVPNYKILIYSCNPLMCAKFCSICSFGTLQ